MRRPSRFVHIGLLTVALFPVVFLTSCQQYRNFTTYYNRLWNMERIMAEVEDEVEYFRSKEEAPSPQYIVPFDETGGEEFYSDHLDKRTLTPDEVRKHKIKLDSVVLKGSLLLEHQSESDYVDDAIFYIAKAYFYEREWYLSQKKVVELIENFPNSEWQPDAHLIYAMDLLKQGELEEAEDMLSKTVDIAFRFKRQDVLTEAFRLNADVQLAQNESGQAIKPYERAILLSDDDEEKARWQYEIGAVYFRSGRFERAVEAFRKVEEYDPDDRTEFEAKLQEAVALRAQKKYDAAETILDGLEEEDDYEDWTGLVQVERLSLQADREDAVTFNQSEVNRIDSLGGAEFVSYGIYERGVRAFRVGEYESAYNNFSRVAGTKSPFNRKARNYAIWIGYYRDEMNRAHEATRIQLIPFPDSLGLTASRSYYNVARFFANYALSDSTEHYYREALDWAPDGSEEAARALYALSEFVRRQGNGVRADSLLTVLAEDYGDNEYAREARSRLGYSEEFVQDEARIMFESGRSTMENSGNYGRAKELFLDVVDKHAGSPYAAQALYAIGFLYEEYLDNPDSALRYYRLLIERYPESVQAREMRPVIERTLASRDSDTTDDGEELVPLGEADQVASDETDAAESDSDTSDTVQWYDDQLYTKISELAFKRRAKRTADESYP